MRHGSRGTYIHAKCRCDDCSRANREYMRSYYVAHKTEALEKQAKERATEPEKFKARKVAYRREHLEDTRAYGRTYQKTPAGRAADYRAKAKRRTVKKAVGSETVDRSVVLLMCKGLCGICGEPIDPEAAWHVDHIVPLSRGGTHTYANCQSAHPLCNKRKRDKIQPA